MSFLAVCEHPTRSYRHCGFTFTQNTTIKTIREPLQRHYLITAHGCVRHCSLTPAEILPSDHYTVQILVRMTQRVAFLHGGTVRNAFVPHGALVFSLPASVSRMNYRTFRKTWANTASFWRRHTRLCTQHRALYLCQCTFNVVFHTQTQTHFCVPHTHSSLSRPHLMQHLLSTGSPILYLSLLCSVACVDSY